MVSVTFSGAPELTVVGCYSAAANAGAVGDLLAELERAEAVAEMFKDPKAAVRGVRARG